MRAVVQRVAHASVTVDGQTIGRIDRGLLVFLGVAQGDDQRDVEWMVDKVKGLRIFSGDSETTEGQSGKMNRDVADVGGKVLVVSQFTLLADVRKGRRPSFVGAMAPEPAERLYESFAGALRNSGVGVETGRFRADMKVHSLNDGPVTLVIDSPRESEARNPGAPPLSSSGSSSSSAGN